MSSCTGSLKVEERLRKDRRDAVRLRAAADVGRLSNGATTGHILICKGAVEEVFAACTRYAIDGDDRARSMQSHFASAKETTAKLNADGFRVVAVAFKEMPPTQAAYSVADEADLTLLGYIAFLDPPKETRRGGDRHAEGTGVQVKILTGDNEIVTRKICHEVGLTSDRIVLGREIETHVDDELADAGRDGRRVRQGLAGAEGARSSTPCTARATSSAFSATASTTARR